MRAAASLERSISQSGTTDIPHTRTLNAASLPQAPGGGDNSHAQAKPTTSEKNLYERLGGVFAIAAVVNHFSDAVVKNPIVGQKSKNPQLREWHTKNLGRRPGLKFMRTPLNDAILPAVDLESLEDALAAGTLAITEVSAEGQVSELRVKNSGENPVLILDGEELSGAKQNRIVNVTIVAPPQADIVIPVSCIEAGRWADSRSTFGAAGPEAVPVYITPTVQEH